ncbi:GH10414 [Drosophila grimshawi]|uniref:Lipase n=1 Tax=Drosophila grimshawi TaxID=7222 RepID=B4JE88_DROGR|nr:GH10414 [Drosophila grimshawi]
MFRFYYCLIWLCLHGNLVLARCGDAAFLEDAHLPSPGLIRKYGYPFEEHKIETNDGFLLTAHRIPKRGGPPVLLVHGLQDSSAAWLVNGPDKALAYLLSNRGYDVWMLNVRGNRYSRRHINYKPRQRQFWDFSFHEIGIYDLPATIDYILNRSGGYRNLHYVGHSQGTTSFFVMGSERPAYMKKIKLFQGLAPVAYFAYMKQSLGKYFAPYMGEIVRLAYRSCIYEFPPQSKVLKKVFYKLCTVILHKSCTFLIMKLAGVDYRQLNSTTIQIYIGHFPAGGSVKSFDHYAQQINSGGFFKYNYRSVAKNRRAYGSAKPPAYELGNVDCKVALYYGKNDLLAAVKDVRRLRNELPNVVHDELLTYRKFNHIDFLVAIDVRKLLYDSMFSVMKRVEDGEL